MKWNVDGMRPSKPPAEYVAFVERKRRQFALLGLTTYILNIILTCVFVYAMEESRLDTEVLSSVVSYNTVAIAFGAALSYLA